mmetsp:Transcript_26767/g.25634  ORF Transcript_26767/g.25634 Transcript_26767/m.25634 type:complete len:551 (-) Transcript_26767:20-1672(-)|eukprot:CAMPEP_0119033488 /NCGR_PEP_ID=MMETSP1177-20130426/530_1 /TAXON_ID=2985 /ORGANISM="Ochromonas sp, Strain CCMP1899" /LENGTH=550 /DNA_ID=CAMNT_0006990265 /DNA_START=206 /DNA_END=1858 /DNA_ORIENTATION=-
MMQKKVSPQRLPKLKCHEELNSPSDKHSFKLLQREEINAKKSRIGHVLTQQYVTKYGSKASISKINSFIKSAVKELLREMDGLEINEKVLSRLESDIKNHAEEIKNGIRDNTIVSLQTQDAPYINTALLIPEEKPISPDKLSSKTTVLDRDIAPSPLPEAAEKHTVDSNQWSVVSAMLALTDEEQRLKESRLLQSRKNKFKNELDKQSSQRKAKELEVQMEKQRMVDQSRSSVSRFEEEIRQTQILREEKAKQVKTLRLAQMAESKEKRAQDKYRVDAQDQLDVALARKLTIEEEDRKQVHREQRRRAFDAIREEDERNKSLKEEKISTQKEYESKQTRDYEAKMQQEEFARKHAYQARQDAKAALAEAKNSNHDELKMFEAKRVEKLRADRVLEEQRTSSEYSRLLEADKDRERKKTEKRRQEVLRSSEYNLSLIDRKEQKKQQEREDAATYRSHMDKEADKQRVKDEANAEKKRLLMWEVKFTLDEQVKKTNKFKVNDRILSDKEISLNKGIFEKLESDPEFREKLYARLNPPPPTLSDSRESNHEEY